jgi:hypothetical protein
VTARKPKGKIALSAHHLREPHELDNVEPDSLTNRERIFVSRYVETGKAGQSAEDAGFARGHSSTLLRRPAIVTAVRAAYEGSPHVLSTPEILRMWASIARDEDAQPHARLQAAADTLKFFGTLTPDEVTVNVRVDPRVREMSTAEQLEYLLAKARKT